MGVDAKNAADTGEDRDLTKCEIVSEVTVEMILNDLAHGRSRTKIAARYAYKDSDGELKPFEKWMVDEMFKDPALVGKTPFKGRIIPFTFKGSVDSPVKSLGNVGTIERTDVPEENTTPETPNANNGEEPTDGDFEAADTPQLEDGGTQTNDPIEVG